MTDLVILCDQSETDELGIRLTAKEMGIPLDTIPFYNSVFSFDHQGYTYKTKGKDWTRQLLDARVVINRCQSKNRRINASAIIESLNIKALNPQKVEYNCHSKLRTLLLLASNGIIIPKTVFTPQNPREWNIGVVSHDNIESICDLLQSGLRGKIVIKPDAGTHGIGVSLASNREELREVLNSVSPSITNPSGVLGQELVSKWFYDLRILVRKEKGSKPVCHSYALARGGFKEFRTNTFLGNMVFRAKLPDIVRKNAVRCVKALCGEEDAYVIALDAMPSIPIQEQVDEILIRDSFTSLVSYFSEVTRVKRRPIKKSSFREYTRLIDEAYRRYMDAEPYKFIESVINRTLEKNATTIRFHEGNSCPEFWEQTRVVGGINLAEDILNSAQSIIDR